MLKLNLVFGNILLIFLSMEREALPRTLSACSVTGLLLVFRPHVQFLMLWGVQSWESTAGIKVCITITKKEEERRADLKKARDELGGNIREKEAALNKKRKQEVMDSLLMPRNKRCFSSMCMRTAR